MTYKNRSSGQTVKQSELKQTHCLSRLSFYFSLYFFIYFPLWNHAHSTAQEVNIISNLPTANIISIRVLPDTKQSVNRTINLINCDLGICQMIQLGYKLRVRQYAFRQQQEHLPG